MNNEKRRTSHKGTKAQRKIMQLAMSYANEQLEMSNEQSEDKLFSCSHFALCSLLFALC
jgi:hypothetical protein